LDEESSPPSRYRGRRRVPVAPRSRYVTVATTAIVGAGVVALGAGASFDDAKDNPAQLAAFGGGGLDETLAERAEAAERASRAERQSDGLASSITEAPDIWMLPVVNYTLSSPYGERWGRLHAGTDLAADCGEPVYAANGGTVILARYDGGYGLAVVIDHGQGVQTVYGHNSEVLVSEGQEIAAGDPIARVGNTGFSFGCHVHFEVHIDGVATDPVPWLRERGVDLVAGTDPLYTG
jgi:murein DD-endopeptidase MepM/ murein hydrolase activator NlpD